MGNKTLQAPDTSGDMSRSAAMAFLTNKGQDNDLDCFSRYGSRTYDCAVVAYRACANLKYHNGDEINRDSLHHMMGLVVNGRDEVAHILSEYKIPRQRRTEVAIGR